MKIYTNIKYSYASCLKNLLIIMTTLVFLETNLTLQMATETSKWH